MRTDRDRHADALEDLDLLPEDQQGGSAGELLQTFTESVYPTTAGRVYACHPVLIDVDDTEGAEPTYTVDALVTIYAVNIGSEIPDTGTKVIGIAVGGRMVFEHSTPPP
jgi:hypothetical protein